MNSLFNESGKLNYEYESLTSLIEKNIKEILVKSQELDVNIREVIAEIVQTITVEYATLNLNVHKR
jgi:hypothetical protein